MRQYFVALFLSSLVVSGMSLAEAADCLPKFNVSGEGTCSKITVRADWSVCANPPKHKRSKAKVKCSSDTNGTATLDFDGKHYETTVSFKDEAWGKRAWSTGEVLTSGQETATAPHPTDKAEKVAEKHAEKKAEKAAEPAAPAAAAPAMGLSWSAYADMSFAYNFNKPPLVSALSTGTIPSNSIRPPQNTYHYYDWYHDQLNLQLAEITLQYKKEETSFLVDLDFGENADINAAYTTTGGYGVDEISKHLGQAIISYNPKALPGWSFDFGKMYAHVGLETSKAKDNWNYSRSINFVYGGPIWHTGAHIGIPLAKDTVTAGVYVYNGWNTIYENNFTPTWGLQLKLTPNSAWTWVFNWLGGPEQAANADNWKHVLEANVTYNVNDKLSLNADFLYGSEKNAPVTTGTQTAAWDGAQGGFRYQFGAPNYLSGRVEFFRDHAGYLMQSGTPTTAYSYTVTYGWKWTPELETRFEWRLDHSNINVFPSQGTAALKGNQNVLELGLLYTMN